ncbi:ParB family protein [Vibrio alginolyticus]
MKAELKSSRNKERVRQSGKSPLAHFDSNGMFARKRVKVRKFSYEFGRLS